MKSFIVRLWQGKFGLARSFWDFGILYGSLIHLLATGAAFGAFAADAPVWLAVALYFLPAPYTILVVVAVWRSAEAYQGPRNYAHLACIAIVAWALLATVL